MTTVRLLRTLLAAFFAACALLSAPAVANPDLRERFAGMSVEPMATTPEALRDFMNAEIDRWGQLIREAGIRVD